MLNIEIPGFDKLRLQHLVLDYNGTLAQDGRLQNGIAGRLRTLRGNLQLHVLTADTFGNARAELGDMPEVRLTILDPRNQAEAKRACVEKLGAPATVCIGNGRNDRLMLQEAALGIAVVQGEGGAGDALRAADVVTCDIAEALDLLIFPQRLVATLRS